MDKVITVIEVIAPIFFAVLLGIGARKKQTMGSEEIQGIQRFAVQFCLPCVIFRSCLTADISAQTVGSMVLVAPLVIIATLWSFRARKRQFPYVNLPMLFSCKETGMMGIPLFMVLFGADQAFRMGIFDIAQAFAVYPVLAILAAGPDMKTTPGAVVKQMLSSTLIRLSILGLVLNLTGIWHWVQSIGIGSVVLEAVDFMSQPVSALMLFCVGYNFNLSGDNRSAVFRLTAVHVGVFMLIGLLVQAGLFLIPGVDAVSRWAALLYVMLPASYLAPGLGRSQEDATVTSGVCSITTLIALAVFCVMAVMIA